MTFDEVYTYLFDGYAVVIDDDEIIYMGEEGDESFYIDSNQGANFRRFTAEDNQGDIVKGQRGFDLKAEDGKCYRIQRLTLG